MKSMGKERMTAPWFTWLHEECGQGKDDCPLVYLVTWRVWARKGWLPPGFPGYMKSMGKERMTAPWFSWLHEEYGQGKDDCPQVYLVTWEYGQGKDVCPLVYLVTWWVWARKECLPPGLPGYMMSMGKERMSAPRNVSLGKVCRSYEGNLAEPWHLASVLGTVNRTR